MKFGILFSNVNVARQPTQDADFVERQEHDADQDQQNSETDQYLPD